MLKDDFEYYKANQDEIAGGHIDELVVIKDCEVKGYYRNWDSALEASKSYALGSFMITDCKPKGADIAKFHNSMIRFAAEQ